MEINKTSPTVGVLAVSNYCIKTPCITSCLPSRIERRQEGACWSKFTSLYESSTRRGTGWLDDAHCGSIPRDRNALSHFNTSNHFSSSLIEFSNTNFSHRQLVPEKCQKASIGSRSSVSSPIISTSTADATPWPPQGRKDQKKVALRGSVASGPLHLFSQGVEICSVCHCGFGASE